MPILTCFPLTLRTVMVTSSPIIIDSLVRLLNINNGYPHIGVIRLLSYQTPTSHSFPTRSEANTKHYALCKQKRMIMFTNTEYQVFILSGSKFYIHLAPSVTIRLVQITTLLTMDLLSIDPPT